MHELRDQLGGWVYPVHRLDRSASGAIIFAKSAEAAAELSGLFSKREVRKTYWAVVRGWASDNGTIDTPLQRHDAKGKPIDGEAPQPAVTHYKRIGRLELPIPLGAHTTARYSLVEVEIETGRLHQIRRHFQKISYPLIGDTVRGDGAHNRLWRDRFGLHRLMLFSRRLSFIWKNQTIDVECPIPDEARPIVQQMLDN